ncbi:MAG: rhodanese-like domain-containing protein [Epsilonproteobacteria bacterium]|nr:rhodanese-like domain-containing protein [Campylobacterota bacterium]
MLDVRYPFERDVWGVNFSINIPLNELPDRLGELPKDKIIVCACPEACRSNIAKQYLAFKGYDAKILTCGLLKLMERLKGGKAKDLQIS